MNKRKTPQKKNVPLIFAGWSIVALIIFNTIPAQAQTELGLAQSAPESSNLPQSGALFAPPFQSSQTITVDSAAFLYTGAWSHDSNCTGAYNSTCSNANSSGAYATYSFTGSAMTIYSRTANNRGKMHVYVDDTLLATVDLYTSSVVNQNPVYSTTFPYGDHTVILQWAGTKNPSSSDYKIFTDKITYTGDDDTIDDPDLTYTGTWLHDSNCLGAAYNNTCSNANSSGAYATKTFTGSTVIIFARTANNRGKMQVYLDDILQDTVDLYSSSVVDEKMVYSAHFSSGQHTVKLQWAGTKNSSSSDYKIFIDKMTFTNELITVDDPDLTYTGTWLHDGSCTGAYNNTCSDTNSSGAYTTHTFTGSAMTVYARTGYDRGKMNVYLDDNLLSTVDLYSASVINEKVVYTGTFSPGEHTVKLERAGTKNTNSSNYQIFIDKIAYLFTIPATPTPTPTNTLAPTNTPTPTSTPTNGYNYDRPSAVNYANSWAHDRNDDYPLLTGNESGCDCDDCTNFMSQVLLAGGYPFHYQGSDWANAWWHNFTTSSLTWSYIPAFQDYALNYYPSEFATKSSAGALEAGDLILLDLMNNSDPQGGPDGIPDHVRVVVDESGYISQNQEDYTDGCGNNLEIPASTSDILINQHCIDRWHVKWDYGITIEGKIYIHVID